MESFPSRLRRTPVLNILGWLLVAAAVVLVAISFRFPASLPAGVLLAIAGLFFTQARASMDSAEKRSKFYLESCAKGFEEARNLLSDGNNDRAKWIAAGRALIHAKELSCNVTLDEHKRVLALDKLKYRKFFHEALADKSAAFFYGAKDPSITTQAAAKLSTAPEERAGRVFASTVKHLSDESLYAVWEAAQWPEEYQDPLRRTFSEQERSSLLVLYPGLHDYLEFKEHTDSASGELFPKSTDGNR